ncbi:MAG: hypothetical protein PHC90_06850 [Syntrophorhabdaceae bacterium]|nr:hypothetical protein [Syntrophorhabdaceae bacterium]
MQDRKTDIVLSLGTDMKFLPLVLSFTESSSRIFGLEDKDLLKLTLASEELFAYLCRMTKEPRPVTLTMENGFYYALLRFVFEGIDFDPRAFNLTADVSPDEEGFNEMGLLIASRSVDRMSIFHNAMEGTGFVLIKEKTYPAAEPWESDEVPENDGLPPGTPGVEDLRVLVRSIVSGYDLFVYPQDFRCPGKVVDMVESGEYRALTATDRKGRTAGGMIWRQSGGSMVECYGPYVFVKEGRADLAERLIAGLISAVARSEAVCLMNRYPTADLPAGYFESLGTIEFVHEGQSSPWRFLFRQLREDPGCRVYCHPGMEEFLQTQYRRHFLPREIVAVRYEGERQNLHSVFGASFQHNQDLVVIVPLWDGADARENLARHISVLKAEGIANILMRIDLGHGWQARLYPVIEANGFVPAIVIPYRGKADCVLFTLKG